MWRTEFIVSWLQENLVASASSETALRDVGNKFKQEGGTLSDKTVTRYINRIFPNTKVIRKFNYKSSKEERIYTGLTMSQNTPEAHSENLNDIKAWISTPFFVCMEEREIIKVALISDILINGNSVIKTIHFKSNNTWCVYVGDTVIDLEKIGIENTFIFSKTSIENVLSLVLKLRLCHGKIKENISEIHHQHVTEYFGSERTPVYRSLKCLRVTPFLNFSTSCLSCSTLKRKSPSSVSFAKDHVDKTVNPVQITPDRSPKIEIPNVDESPSSSSVQPGEIEKLVLKESTDLDLRIILENVIPQASGEMLDMLIEQKKNLARNPNGRRWDRRTISLCLSLWCRSPKNYNILKDSNILVLPSAQTLRLYKNSVDQGCGFNKDVMKWMAEAASKTNLNDSGMCGGIAIDEMSIQEDLCLVHEKGEVKLVGFVDICEESEYIQKLCYSKSEKKIATHVLQFLYIGLNGYRFPFACFPVTQTKAGDLHFLFWNAVKFLNTYGFKVCFISMDGAQTNRDFLKMFFSDTSPAINKFSIKNVWFPNHPPIIFIMDFSHVIKRIRNNISKSGEGSNMKRHLQYFQPILWEHWKQAFKWDRDTNSFPLHHKLTNEHLFLTPESKMRNKLAQDVLDDEMLHLMLSFKASLGDSGDFIDDSINLLKSTSKIVSVFTDRRPITDIQDIRLEQLKEAIMWFAEWEEHVFKIQTSESGKQKMLMSYQTREDIKSCLIGFIELCTGILKYNRSSIVPARINSDVIENIFCQQRGIVNGNNTNPTFYQYSKNINTVIIGQSVLSKTCNTGSGNVSPVKTLTNPKRNRIDSSGRKPLKTLPNPQ